MSDSAALQMQKPRVIVRQQCQDAAHLLSILVLGHQVSVLATTSPPTLHWLLCHMRKNLWREIGAMMVWALAAMSVSEAAAGLMRSSEFSMLCPCCYQSQVMLRRHYWNHLTESAWEEQIGKRNGLALCEVSCSLDLQNSLRSGWVPVPVAGVAMQDSSASVTDVFGAVHKILDVADQL